MPSPFPGIDPYLESQGYWPDFHASFIPYCRDALNDILPETYDARIDERLRLIELSEPERTTAVPDIAIHEAGTERRGALQTGAGVLTLEPVTIDLPDEEFVEVLDRWIEIRHRPDRKLVTAIEVLSPTNKTGEGFHDYCSKRRSLIRQQVHLVEFDFLIRGQRLPMRQKLPPGDFFVFTSRAERRPKCDVYGWSVRQALPRIPIPLLAPDPDIVLDLQAVFATGYDRGRYARGARLHGPPGSAAAPGRSDVGGRDSEKAARFDVMPDSPAFGQVSPRPRPPPAACGTPTPAEARPGGRPPCRPGRPRPSAPPRPPGRRPTRGWHRIRPSAPWPGPRTARRACRSSGPVGGTGPQCSP